MSQQFIDRAYEDCTPVGTTTATLLGAKTGFVPIPAGDSVCLIEGISGTVLTGAWEVVEGSRSGNTFTRTRVIASSNSNNPVDFNSPAEIALVVGSEWYAGVDIDITGLRTDTDQNTSNIASVFSDLNTHIADNTNPHSVTKTQVGLGNVDNTSDADKPVSTAQQSALDTKVDLAGDTMTGTLTNLNTLLSALDKQVNANAVVDVFIYDTSLDDDGGAWVDKANWQSWYHEPLNTTTRGKTRAFPKLALLIAESNKVTIYDANDPDLPMWMVFNHTPNGWLYAVESISSVAMKNGVLYVACTGSNYNGTLNIMSIEDDKSICTFLLLSAPSWRNVNPCSMRNVNSGSVKGSPLTIVGQSCNDVAVTSDGSMNNTVAVATEGGVSVIHPDGTVADIAGFATAPNYVGLTNDALVCRGRYVGHLDIFAPIPTTDITANDYDRNYHDGVNSIPPTFSDLMVSRKALIFKNKDTILAHNEGVTNLFYTSDKATDMAVYRTSGYCSGYLHGDIRGAFLANSKTADRSHSNNPLTETGTVTEAAVATGAELKCYTGFSTSNYLQQAYNSDLDFGTGDFYAMAWVSVPDDTGYHGIFDRDSNNQDTETGIVLLTTNSKYVRCKVGGISLTGDSVQITPNQFKFVAIKRSSDILTLYVEGKPVKTVTANVNIADSSATLTVGGYWQIGSLVGGSKVSLFRIGAGAPSDEQIKQIYEAEKPLFQENARCLLQGTSNDIKALDYDDSSNTLTVCSADHITKFNGLRVVGDESVAVTSVSAVSKKILKGSSLGADYEQPEINLRELANKLGL